MAASSVLSNVLPVPSIAKVHARAGSQAGGIGSGALDAYDLVCMSEWKLGSSTSIL